MLCQSQVYILVVHGESACTHTTLILATSFFTFAGYTKLEMELQAPVVHKLMTELCHDWKEDGTVFVRCSSLCTKSSMYKHLHSFALMADSYKSNVFRALWSQTTSRYKRLEDVGTVWETTIEKCEEVVSMFFDGTIEISDLQDWIGSLDFEDHVFQDLSQLINGLGLCGMPSPNIANEEVLRKLCKKIAYYQRANQSCYTANLLLQLSGLFACRNSCLLLTKIVEVIVYIVQFILDLFVIFTTS